MLSLALWAPSTVAQSTDGPNPLYERRIGANEAVKQRSIFEPAARDTAAEQLAYANALRDKGRERKAIKQYGALVAQWHTSSEAAHAQLEIAQLQMMRGKYEDAFDEYAYLIRHYYRTDPRYAEALFERGFTYDAIVDAQFRAANAVKTRRVGRIFMMGGWEAPERALPMYRWIVENSPASKHSDRARLNIALIHQEKEEWLEAELAYDGLIRRGRDARMVDIAYYGRAYALVEIADDEPYNERATRKAIAALSTFLRRAENPEDSYYDASRAKRTELQTRLARKHFNVAHFYETKAKKPRAALQAYETFVRNYSRHAAAADLVDIANARIDALQTGNAQ